MGYQDSWYVGWSLGGLVRPLLGWLISAPHILMTSGGSDSKVSAYNAGDQVQSLEKAVATHSSTRAWKIPWSEEPGRLLSLGLGRVRHD